MKDTLMRNKHTSAIVRGSYNSIVPKSFGLMLVGSPKMLKKKLANELLFLCEFFLRVI